MEVSKRYQLGQWIPRKKVPILGSGAVAKIAHLGSGAPENCLFGQWYPRKRCPSEHWAMNPSKKLPIWVVAPPYVCPFGQWALQKITNLGSGVAEKMPILGSGFLRKSAHFGQWSHRKNYPFELWRRLKIAHLSSEPFRKLPIWTVDLPKRCPFWAVEPFLRI